MIQVSVMEDSQMGMSLGMIMSGKTVVEFYSRWNFIICATNQSVDHVNKIGLMSNGKRKTNLIIRLGNGSDEPLNPGHQHRGNYFEELK